jgi:hypothetical protein
VYISINYFARILVALSVSFLGGYDIMNSCMFTWVISHLIWLQVGCSGTVVGKLLSYGIWRIPVLSCRWSFGLCRGCCVRIIAFQHRQERKRKIESSSESVYVFGKMKMAWIFLKSSVFMRYSCCSLMKYRTLDCTKLTTDTIYHQWSSLQWVARGSCNKTYDISADNFPQRKTVWTRNIFYICKLK